MTIKWKEVRVFISSTFIDMQAERDYLVKRVFPDLREWCEQRKLRLMDIDLRWGISLADASSRRAVKLCLERINDCRPFFLCFVGQRHGSTLDVDNISPDTFEEFPDLKRALHPAVSITELEIRHAVFSPFATFDPAGLNQLIQSEPAKHAFFYFRDPSYLDELAEAPRQLLCIYADDFGPEDESEQERQMRELSRDAVQDLRRDISSHSSSRTVMSQPVTYKASWRPELSTPELAMPLEFNFPDAASRRRWQSTWNRFGHLDLTDANLRIPDEKRAAANDYNEVLTRGRLGQFHALEQERDRFPAGTELARIIQHDLQRAILSSYPDHLEVANTSNLQREIDQHEEFISGSVEGFIDRRNDFVDLDDYVEGNSDKPFVLTSPGGMGKSTLLAKWIDRYRMLNNGESGESMHFRFIGQSDLSTTVTNLLYYLLRELQEITHKIPATTTKILHGLGDDEVTVEIPLEIPRDPAKLRQAWSNWLTKIGECDKTIIVIDALNQLETGLSDLSWIPERLPNNIKMILSFKRDDQESEEVYQRFKEGAQANISEVKPFEDEEDRRHLIDAYLSQYLKELDEQHLETLIGLHGAQNPLYLKIVLSELRVFGVFGNLGLKIRDGFGQTPLSAFIGVLNRLEDDPEYSPIDPKQAVPLLFGLLAHARHGLSVDELTSIFIQALKLEDNATSRQDAADTINLLLRQVRPFISRRDGRYDFFFESFKIAAQQRYAAQGAGQLVLTKRANEWHKILADYFYELPIWLETTETEPAQPTASRQPTRRKMSELPFHLTHAKEWDRLEKILCDLHFIEAKVMAGMVFELEADYDVALDALPEAKQNKKRERAHEQDIERYTKALIAYAKAGSETRGKPTRPSILSKLGKLTRNQRSAPFPEMVSSIPFRNENKKRNSEHSTRLERILPFANFVTSEGHTLLKYGRLSGICLQQAHNYADSGPVVEAAERILDEGFKDCLILQNRRQRAAYQLRPSLLRTLEGHDGSIWSVSMTPDGKTAVSGGGDGTVRFWDLTTGQCLRRFIQRREVLSVSMTPDGKTVVSGGRPPDRNNEEAIYVWDLITGQSLRKLHKCWYYAIAKVTADGQTVVSGDDKGTLYAWDVKTGECLHRLEGHESGILCISITPDGKTAVSGSKDNTLRVWDLVNGRCLRTLEGHKHSTSAVSVMLNGDIAVSGSNDKTLRIWDLVKGRCLKVLEGHESSVLAVRLTPDGNTVVSGGADRILRVWNVKSGKCLQTLRGHANKVESIGLTPDGKTAVSGSKDGTLRVWNLNASQRLPIFEGHRFAVSDVSLTFDGKTAISAGADTTLRVWDVDMGHCVGTLEGHEEAVLRIATTADGGVAVSASEDNTLKVWHLATGTCLRTLRGHSEPVWGLSMAVDGRIALSGSVDCTLRVWDIATGQCLQVYDGRGFAQGFVMLDPLDRAPWPDSIQGISLTADGKVAVSTHYDTTLRVWDLTTGKYLNILRGHRGAPRCLSLLPNGRTVVSGGDDSTLRLWDLVTGELLSTLETEIGTSVRSVSVSADGLFAFADSGDHMMQVWNLETRECLAILPMSYGGIKVSELRAGARIGIGSYAGECVLANLHNFKFGITTVTAARIWLTEKDGTGGRWDQRITALCEHCGQRFEPSAVVLDAIYNISAHLTPYQSPTLELPVEAWNEPRLLMKCPHCHNGVRFNPFVVDNRA